MLKLSTMALGCLSYAAAFICALVDSILFLAHQCLRTASDKFLSDGNALTGWRVEA